MNFIQLFRYRTFPGHKTQINDDQDDRIENAHVILQIFRELGQEVKSIPFVCKSWSRLFFGPYYDLLYAEKKPFGIREWKEHLHVHLPFQPRIRMDKLIKFEPEHGYLTYIPVKLRFKHSDGSYHEEFLNYDNILRCANLSRTEGEMFYKFDQETLARYFQFRSPQWIVEEETPREGYWIDIGKLKKIGPQEVLTLFHISGKKVDSGDEPHPRLLPMLVSMIAACKRSGAFFSLGKNYFVVKGVVKNNPLLVGAPNQHSLFYKLCIATTETGFSIRPVLDLRQQVQSLKFVHAEHLLRESHFLSRVFKAFNRSLESYQMGRLGTF